jgi:hypothetical protein
MHKDVETKSTASPQSTCAVFKDAFELLATSARTWGNLRGRVREEFLNWCLDLPPRRAALESCRYWPTCASAG